MVDFRKKLNEKLNEGRQFFVGRDSNVYMLRERNEKRSLLHMAMLNGPSEWVAAEHVQQLSTPATLEVAEIKTDSNGLKTVELHFVNNEGQFLEKVFLWEHLEGTIGEGIDYAFLQSYSDSLKAVEEQLAKQIRPYVPQDALLPENRKQ